MKTLKSVLLLALAMLVALNSYSNYKTAARVQTTPRISTPAIYTAVYERYPRSHSDAVVRGLVQGLRLNLSLTILLLFSIAISVKERIR